jgi:hypothetical protein
MKKSLRLLLGTIALGAVIAATAISQTRVWDGGMDPQPQCPPGGCAIN